MFVIRIFLSTHWRHLLLRIINLHLVHADSVDPEEDRVDGPGRDDGVEHPLEEAPGALRHRDLPGHGEDGGGPGRGLLDHLIRMEDGDWSIGRMRASHWSGLCHLHCVQRMAKHKTCGPAHPAGYKRKRVLHSAKVIINDQKYHVPTKSHQDICPDLYYLYELYILLICVSVTHIIGDGDGCQVSSQNIT